MNTAKERISEFKNIVIESFQTKIKDKKKFFLRNRIRLVEILQKLEHMPNENTKRRKEKKAKEIFECLRIF